MLLKQGTAVAREKEQVVQNQNISGWMPESLGYTL